MEKILNNLDLIALAIAAIYEITARLIPSTKTFSIITLIYRFFSKILPDNRYRYDSLGNKINY